MSWFSKLGLVGCGQTNNFFSTILSGLNKIVICLIIQRNLFMISHDRCDGFHVAGLGLLIIIRNFLWYHSDYLGSITQQNSMVHFSLLWLCYFNNSVWNLSSLALLTVTGDHNIWSKVLRQMSPPIKVYTASKLIQTRSEN